MLYRGIICQRPLRVHSYEGRFDPNRHTQEQREELIEDEVQQLLPQLVNAPLRYIHKGMPLELGHITGTYRTPEGHVGVEFTFNETTSARAKEADVRSGILRGLSLSHDPASMRVVEVSLTEYGARPGTEIEQRMFTNDKTSSYVLPPRIDIMAAAADSSKAAPMETEASPPAAAAPPAATETAPAPAAAAAAPVVPEDEFLAKALKNPNLTAEEKAAMVEFAIKQKEESNKLRERLVAQEKDSETYLRTYATTVDRLLTLTGVSNGENLKNAHDAFARGDTSGFMREMTTPLVECTAAVERLLTQQQQAAAQRKRTAEDDARLNSLIEAYNQLSKQKITRTDAPAPGLVNASTTPARPAQQQQQPPAAQSSFEEQLNARLAHLSKMNVQTMNLKGVHERAKRLREH